MLVSVQSRRVAGLKKHFILVVMNFFPVSSFLMLHKETTHVIFFVGVHLVVEMKMTENQRVSHLNIRH